MSEERNPYKAETNEEYRRAPTKLSVKYLALKYCNNIKSKRLPKVIRKLKEAYVKDMLLAARTSEDSSIPPCVNCCDEQVYYCYKFSIECKTVMTYYVGRRSEAGNNRRRNRQKH